MEEGALSQFEADEDALSDFAESAGKYKRTTSKVVSGGRESSPSRIKIRIKENKSR